jgi:hypothetical protein
VRISEPEYDVGATSALIGPGPVDLPGSLMAFVNAARRWIISRYVRTYTQQQPLDPQRLRYYGALRLLAFLTEAGYRPLPGREPSSPRCCRTRSAHRRYSDASATASPISPPSGWCRASRRPSTPQAYGRRRP